MESDIFSTTNGCYNRLVQIALEDAKISEGDVIRMTYIDEDADVIRFSSDRELVQAWESTDFNPRKVLRVKAEVETNEREFAAREQMPMLKEIINKNNELLETVSDLKELLHEISSKKESNPALETDKKYQQVLDTVSSEGETFYIINPETGKALDVCWGGKVNGTNVHLWHLNYTGAQKWTLKSDGTICNPQSGKCLDFRRSETNANDNDNVVIWEKNGSESQVWKLTNDGTIMNSQSGKRLDICEAARDDGTNIITYEYNAAKNQQWRLVPTDCLLPQGRTIKIISAHSGNALHVAYGRTANGTDVHAYQRGADNGAQQWILTADSTIYNPPSGKCLDLCERSTCDGVRVHLWEMTGDDSQGWKFCDDGTIRNVFSGKCLSVTSDSLAIYMREFNGEELQRWIIMSD
eukprot:CAMPEP_0172486448 /NCGR_PEP_ID=MMETSP1066-20121228/15033_1 /TAXON_ID=671091 /ORGANISM="Coscinodiscus wailesii, Strain CCMP2513" /LENGTH=408 /DNA_ID=CAMNT_0013252417 /DNA_START=108 /DNA_END=1334 /DNA_ORIENTATION=+